MTESERAVMPQQTGPVSVSVFEDEGVKKERRKRERGGLLKSCVHLSHSFYLFSLFVFFSPHL